jgi:cell division protein FtsB
VLTVIRSWLDKNARSLAIALMMAMLFLYFVYVTVQGDRGILAMLQMQGTTQAAEAELAALRAERATLEARVKHMRGNSIDPDLLDEQSRSQLNLAGSNDVVVFTAPQQSEGSAPQMVHRNKN